MSQKVRKAVIPAAGLGTRFLPVTKSVPKELLPIGTRPTLLIVIEEALDAGIEEIVLITSMQKSDIMEFFRGDTDYVRELEERGKSSMLNELNDTLHRIKISTVIQHEALGLGHAVLCAKEAVGDEPFIVILPDVLIASQTPCCKQLMDAYAQHGCSLSATEHTPREQIHLYGIYDVARTEGKLHWAQGVVEKPCAEEAPSDLSVVGRYLFTPEVFSILETTTAGKGGEIQLADAMNELARNGKFAALEYEGRQFDTGDPIGFLKANIFYSFCGSPDTITPFLREMIETPIEQIRSICRTTKR